MRHCLALEGEIPLGSFLEGERPELYSLPGPDRYVIHEESDDRQTVRWNAHWTNRSRCELVRRSAQKNLRYLRFIRKIYESVRDHENDETFNDEDLQYLLGKINGRIDRWKGIVGEIKAQLRDQDDIQILGT